MSTPRHHAEWLNLVDTSGPFLALPALMRVFPQGLDTLDPELKKRVRLAFDEWLESQTGRPDPALHTAWIRFVLHDVLGYTPDTVLEPQTMPPSLIVQRLEPHETLQPDLAVVNPRRHSEPGKPRLLVLVLPSGTKLDSILKGTTWSHEGRMLELLKATGVPLGLLTNGERWVVMHRLPEASSGQAGFFGTLWLEEPLTLRAFTSLLSAHRLFDVESENTLEALLQESQNDQQEVTDQLGYQVRRAVELLVQAIDRIDQDRDRTLLAGIGERQLYLAAIKVMMRLIFLLAGEERELIGDKASVIYQDHYAVSLLRDQLREVADKHGEEVLERRYDAWARLLATFRAVHGGVHHQDLTLPAFMGSLFNPDEFPFLEGRREGTTAPPLPIHNRTVLHLLEALQLLEVRLPGGGPAEARRLSFKGLGPEQIGHVYEGLLDHTAVRADGLVLGLIGTKRLEPEVALTQLEALKAQGDDALIDWLKEHTGRSSAALARALQEGAGAGPTARSTAARSSTVDVARWQAACGNDPALWARVKPFAPLVRLDPSGWPVLFPHGSLYVTEGTDRRSSGTHYTPREITESVVESTLEPLVYDGPAEGKPREQWRLRSPKELLSLKICDPAMGSGAFLVQACRYLAARLCEAWKAQEASSSGPLRVLPEGLEARGEATEQFVPGDPTERLVVAKRVVAERCLYGVDKNRTATDIAKMSLWLETLSQKPFTFVDHALRWGDSLLGLTDPEQIRWFHLHASTPIQLRIQAEAYPKALAKAVEEREKLESYTVEDAEQYEAKERHRKTAERAVEDAMLVADLLVGAGVDTATRGRTALEERLQSLAILAGTALSEATEEEARKTLLKDFEGKSRSMLGSGPDGEARRPFHWPLEFPEVFPLPPDTPANALTRPGGFDAIIGNPPFMGGQKITGNLGTDYRDFLVDHVAGGQRGSADLCALFFLRALELLKPGGMFGLIATNTIAQGDTREVGLEQVIRRGGTLTRAVPSRKWPGEANLEIAQVWGRRGTWSGVCVLEDREVPAITAFLTRPGKVEGKPFRLKANESKSFIGSYVLGMGFVMSPEEAQALIARDPRNADVLFPYLNGEDLNSRPDQSPSRWVINFRDWPLDRKAGGSWAKASDEQKKAWRRVGSVPADYPEHVAEDYPDCIAIVREKVKPERDVNSFSASAKQYWWRFERLRGDLYSRMEKMDKVMARARIANQHAVILLSTSLVFNEKTVVFPRVSFSVIQSTIHELWARQYSSTLRMDMQYTPSDCFETFPFPDVLNDLGDIGKRYHTHRQSIMEARQEGLTKTYNRFHNKLERSEDIELLRRLHREMDDAVARAYGWNDLATRLGHGFHETKQGVRYTLSEGARQEVLEKLLELNHERHSEEEKETLAQAGPEKKTPGRRGAKAGKAKGDGVQGLLF